MRRKAYDRSLLCVAILVALAFLALSSSAVASPGWQVTGRTTPTELSPGGEGLLKLYVYNLGNEPSYGGGVLTDTLPANVVATGAIVASGEGTYDTELSCSVGQTVTCELPGLKPEQIALVVVRLDVRAGAAGSEVDHVTVSGGETPEPVQGTVPLSFGVKSPGAGFSNLATWVTNENGTVDDQAGSHPYELTVAFGLNDEPVGKLSGGLGSEALVLEHPAGGQARTLNVNLPAGMVGNPQAVPQCPRAMFDSGYNGSCPIASQVGFNVATIDGLELAGASPVYNMVPPPGVAAQFAFIQDGISVFLDSGVRTGGDNGITTHARDVPERYLTFNTTTIWGVPAEESHDRNRHGVLPDGEGCNTGNYAEKARCPARVPVVPFLTLGTSCGAPLEFTTEEVGTWEEERHVAPVARSVLQNGEGDQVSLTGCEKLQPFKPTISLAPDTSYADTPAGLSVDVKMPLGLNREDLESSNLRNTSVVLPEGIVINPGQATGLQACQPAQEAMGTEPDGEAKEGPVSCPAASKVGTDEITSPLLRDKLQGNVYILGQNPPNLQLLVAASGDGVNLKLVGNVHLDESTGQLVTTFEGTPDVPFTDFKLNFSGGAQAALATPTRCGTYESKIDFTPWSGPFVEDALDYSLLGITFGPNGSPCTWPMPFTPVMHAGATTDQAGGYTDFTMLLTRGDGQQRIKTLSFKTPEGLLGMISKVAPCGEPQAAQGTCTVASQIGHTVVGAGPGPYPFYIPQASAPPAPIYLTGPYKGAPFGLSIVVPLIAGPFNLGTEVVRARLEVDPHTSQVTITTDALPQIEKGIPADLRLINAVIDKPEFMFNPTSCASKSFSGTVTSVEGAIAPLTSHFQMGSCRALKFQPDFKVSTSGRTSRANGASLTAKIIYPTGELGENQASSQSNIASVKVDLPRHLPSRLKTLQKACTAEQFSRNPAGCPHESIVGHAVVHTPVLPVPLEGPAYFVSHGGEEFPNLIIVLQGDGVTVDLVGDTFIKDGVTSSTFASTPDVPFGTFELTLPEGPYSALAANVNLCALSKKVYVKKRVTVRSKGRERSVVRRVAESVPAGLVMPTAFLAQNGAVLHQNTLIAITGCPRYAGKAGTHRRA